MKIDNSKDFYKILGVPENASEQDIKKAYRKLSLQWHPDKHKDEDKRKEAEAKFAEINEANDVLSDPEKRRQYDQLRQFGNNPFGGFGGFNPWEPFGGFNVHVNRPQNIKRTYPAGSDINIRVRLTIDDLYNYDKPKIVSYNKQVRCDECHGVGGKDETTCPQCNGTGMFTRMRQQGPITIQEQSPCSNCGGTGKVISEKCNKCGGTGLKTTIAEIDINKDIPREYLFMEDHIINVGGLGNESRSPEMPNGSLYIMIQHDYNKGEYTIDEQGNIYQHLTIPYYDCLIGNPTYTFIACDRGYHSVDLPKCTKENTIIECSEMHGAQIGAKYFIKVHIGIPNELNNREDELLTLIKFTKEAIDKIPEKELKKLDKIFDNIFEKKEK